MRDKKRRKLRLAHVILLTGKQIYACERLRPEPARRTEAAGNSGAQGGRGRPSISRFRIPNQISYGSTIVSNARDAKRRHDAAARKIRKNFSVGALFQNNASLPE